MLTHTTQASAIVVVTLNRCAILAGNVLGNSNVGLINNKHFDTVSTNSSGVKVDKL